MPTELSRKQRNGSVIIASGGTDSEPIDISDMSFGMFELPSAFTGVIVNFKVSVDGGGHSVAVDDTGTALDDVTVAAGQATPFPSSVMHGGSLVITAGAQAAERRIKYILKG